MPKIIVQAQTADGEPAEVTFAERAIPVQEQNEHYLSQLAERVGWALLDAEHLEAGADRSNDDLPPRARREVPSPSERRGRKQPQRGRRRSALGPGYLRAP